MSDVESGLRRGLSNKEIAHECGLNISTVWRTQMKLVRLHGCDSRVTLIAKLGGLDRSSVDARPLSRCERAVVLLALRGDSNAEIAAVRGVSQRTVANQLASAFRKSRVHSRGELAARMAIEADAAE